MFGTLHTAPLVMAFIAVCLPRIAASENARPLQIVSSSASRVSGATALVAIDGGTRYRKQILLNSRDISPSFRRSARTGEMMSLVTGLKPGRNVLEVRVNGRTRHKAELLSHPVSGPIFSGPHQRPFACQTEVNGLGPARDAQCNAAQVIQYYYKSNAPADPHASARATIRNTFPENLPAGFKLYDVAQPRPSDIAQTVLSNGARVNFIVRREIGVINRAVYEIQFLHEPGQPLPTPWAALSAGWNGGLIYMFGGGCEAGFRQGILPAAVLPQQEQILSQGYALATSTLNVLGNNCNERLSSETASMVKEHFIEQYGKPYHTIGVGISSGAVSAYLTAQNDPGILDGIIAFLSAPDHLTTVIPVFSDCALLDHALGRSKHSWTEAQRTAVSGFATWQACLTAGSYLSKLGWLDPKGCPSAVPERTIYDRDTNPRGVRCTYFDNAIYTFGRDPKTGFARRMLDNVGIQYGLVAFNEGRISAEQFIELNELIGGFDADGAIVPARSVASEDALQIAYSQGVVLTGENLGEIPIIDWSIYADDLGDIHTRDRALITRDRLIFANGDARNQAILVTPRPIYAAPKPSNAAEIPGVGLRVLIPAMDRWLRNISTDARNSTRREKVIGGRPAELADHCISAGGEKIIEPASYDSSGRCNAMYPNHGNPRVAAGAPRLGLILKCALKPVDASRYSAALTRDQLTRLKSLFPAGVCDYGGSEAVKRFTQAARVH